MNIEGFLIERLSEARANIGSLTKDQRLVFERMFNSQMLVIDEHKNWPILLEAQPVFEAPKWDDGVVFKMSQQIEFQTREEYRRRFGNEPPTAPILRAMVQVYRDHPDFDESWL